MRTREEIQKRIQRGVSADIMEGLAVFEILDVLLDIRELLTPDKIMNNKEIREYVDKAAETLTQQNN